MTKKYIASLTLKLLGIYSFIKALPYIGGLISSFSITGGWDINRYHFFGLLTSFILLILMGCVLMIFGHKIIKDIDTSAETINISKDITYHDLQAMVFSVVGILVIIFAIPKLLQIGGSYIAIQKMTEEWRKNKFLIDAITSSVGVVIQILLGLGLLFGARGLSYYLHKLRHRWKFERDLTSG